MTVLSKKIRILLVAPIYGQTFSGASYAVQLLKESAFSEQFDLIHLNTCFAKSAAELEVLRPKKLFLFIKYLGALRATLLTTSPDYVIICPAFSKGAFIKDSIYTLLCARLFGRKVIWWTPAWGMRRLYDGSGAFMQRYIRQVVASVYRIVTVGYRQRSDFEFICSADQLFTIHYGVPATEFSLDRFAGRSEIRVLYFANLDTTKGWRILLEAAKQICASQNRFLFDFYGNPAKNSPEGAIKEAFRDSGFPKRICYHGPAYGAAKRQAYEQADIFCFPTFFRHEALSLVNLEAMNAGLPIITTDHANLPEAVIDGHGGFLIPKQDPPALATALLHLSQDSELRRQMGKYNQLRFYEHFTVDKFVSRWTEFMKSLAMKAGV